MPDMPLVTQSLLTVEELLAQLDDLKLELTPFYTDKRIALMCDSLSESCVHLDFLIKNK
jgi:hypothetical protein